jgi:tetratricopeptide (TPR) repeat protein
MSRQTEIILTIGVGAILILGVMLMPRKPAVAETMESVAPSMEMNSEASAAAREVAPVEVAVAAEFDPVEAAVKKVSGENPMEGILALREMAEGDPPNVDAVVWLGIFGIQSGQMDKARERFSEALTIDPSHLEATWQLALLDMEELAYDRAVVGFESVMEADSSYANGLFFTARCYEAMGKTEAAIIRYKEFLPYAPDEVVSARVEEFISRLESGNTAGTNE